MSQPSGDPRLGKRYVILNEDDNVAMAMEDLKTNDTLQTETQKITIRQPIEFGHKFATRRISKGGTIIKHGEIIGEAIKDILPGEHVHVHNVRSLRARSGNEGDQV